MKWIWRIYENLGGAVAILMLIAGVILLVFGILGALSRPDLFNFRTIGLISIGISIPLLLTSLLLMKRFFAGGKGWLKLGISMVTITVAAMAFVIPWQYGKALNVLHYDGSTWSKMSSTTTTGLQNVWGSSASDVFAVGMSGTIVHYDGSTWSKMYSGTKTSLYGIWGSSTSDVFAVGIGTILHYDGNAWKYMMSFSGDSLEYVWGSSASDVFAVGNGGTILHYDGSTWNKMSSGTKEWLYGIWGSSASDVFIVRR
jgi:hypothetical protein